MPAPTEERVSVLESRVDGLQADITQIFVKLDELVTRLSGRPSWAVCTIIALLTMAVGALTTAVIAFASAAS
jgi:hypothetical protein